MKRRTFVSSAVSAGAMALLPARHLLASTADTPAIGRTGKQLVLRGRDIDELRGSLRGQLLTASEEGYEQARRVWNGAFDRRPALIVRCAGASDVVQAVNFGRTQDLLIAVRAGGHSLSGQSVCDGGLMIDLSLMRGVRVDPVAPRMYGGVLLYPLARARELLRFLAEFSERKPEELFVDTMLASLPQVGKALAFSICYSGAPEKGEEVVKPLRQFGPVVDAVRPATYTQLQTAQDRGSKHGRGYYERSGFLTRIVPELIDSAVDCMESAEPPGARIMFTGDCAGAFNRVARDATAFWNRDARSTLIVQAFWEDPRDAAASEAHLRWARQTFERLSPHTKGFYVNTLATDDAKQRVRASYGDNYPRLVTLKRKYDPTNLFRRNANIDPGA
jgi:FAD/FMN-containing dehydrogenase